jgi:hypothetical protein
MDAVSRGVMSSSMRSCGDFRAAELEYLRTADSFGQDTKG